MARWLLREPNITQLQICDRIDEKFGIRLTQSQISKDVRVIREAWEKTQVRNFDKLRTQQIAAYQEVIGESWRAWNDSYGETTTTTKELKGSGVEAEAKGGKASAKHQRITLKTEVQVGVPAYLSQVQAALQQISKLSGLESWIKMSEINFAIASVQKAGFVVMNPVTNEPVPEETLTIEAGQD
jgi:hypothetical protein